MTMIIRRFLNKAVMQGMNRMSGPQAGQKQSKEQKAAMQRARQSMKVMRRVSRF
ncbi:MAG: hypothetical protein WBV62_04775 [Roseobacter sp.]